jgi:hypothetical protein
MISACARGARALRAPELAARAARAAEFVWQRLWNEGTRTLHRRWRDGEAAVPGQLDDYAHVALGLLDLYQADFDPRWLERAVTLVEVMVERFEDRDLGAFFESPLGDARVRVRLKDGHDGAEIAGNSVAAFVTQALGVLLDRSEWRAVAERAFAYYARRLADGPVAMPQMLVAMDLARATPRHVVIAGDPRAADTRALIAEFDSKFRPYDVLLVSGGPEARARLARLAPFAASLAPQGGRATAFVCVDYACRLPATDPGDFAARLAEPAAPALLQERPK